MKKKILSFPIRGKKGIGVGTLMVFIALLLAAAIAAGTILVTFFEINKNVQDTGREILQDVGSGVKVTMISGKNGTDGTIENLTIFIQHADDTLPINLAETLISLELDNTSRDYVYNASYNYSHMDNSTEFALIYVNGPNSDHGFLDRDDLIKMFIYAPRELIQGEMFNIRMIPKLGQNTLVSYNIPDSVVTDEVVVYPSHP